MNNETQRQFLRRYWDEIWEHKKVDAGPLSTRFSELLSAYSEPDRYYHNLQHISAMLRHWEAFRGLLAAPDAVCLAIFYHDIVYDSRRKDNEEKSALLAEKALADLRLSKVQIELVADMIRRTSRHDGKDGSADVRMFLDMDLSILGTEAYAGYSENVRKEYAWVPETDYREGRKQVLASFLSRKSIYFTDEFRDRYESKARENIAQELRRL